jgi:hypothetical protein
MAVCGLIPETSRIWRAKCQKCNVEGIVDAPKAVLLPKWPLVTGLLGLCPVAAQHHAGLRRYAPRFLAAFQFRASRRGDPMIGATRV